MPSPKIKFLVLPSNYTERSDDDVQLQRGDELIPVVPKLEALENAVELTGVRHSHWQPCYPINYGDGRQNETLNETSLNSNRWLPASTAANDVLVGPSGQLSTYIKYTSNNLIIPPDQYEFVLDDSGLLDHVEFSVRPSGSVTLSFYMRASTPCRYWAIPASNPYDGENYILNKVFIDPSGGTFDSNAIRPRYEWAISGPSGSMLDLVGNANSVVIHYWWKDTVSPWFAAEQPHWVVEHMRMNPDVFVGDKDYPGDQGEIDGEPFTQGSVPKFREPGTYQLNANEGWVRFPEDIDSNTYKVRANYAYMTGVRQVSFAKLTAIDGSGTKWRIDPNQTPSYAFKEAGLKPFLNRDDQIFPRTVYVNREQVGNPVRVAPFEILTVKT